MYRSLLSPIDGIGVASDFDGGQEPKAVVG